jgi:hypothetical protein
VPSTKKATKALPYAQRAVLKPGDVERLFDISHQTRYRWEKEGRLPPRDVVIGDKPLGWRPATLGVRP